MATKYFNHYKSSKIPRTSQWRNNKQKRLDNLKRNMCLTINNVYQSTCNTNNSNYPHNLYNYDETNPSFIDEVNINSNPLEQLQQIRIENADDIITRELKTELIHSALLALFFSGNFTQASFKMVLEFTQLFTDLQIPSNFNQLIQTIGEENIEYSKKWFCNKCQIQIEPTKSNQRICTVCSNR